MRPKPLLKRSLAFSQALLSKLSGAKAKAAARDYVAAINMLKSFINQVEAQCGKKIQDAVATELMHHVEQFLAVLEDPSCDRAQLLR